MKRPSHWILLMTVAAVIAWVCWKPRPTATEEPAPAPAPTVVRRSLAPPAEDPTAVLVGRVVDRLGWPIEGASVRARANGRETATDRQGRFALRTGDGSRGESVELSAPGFAPEACWLVPQEEAVRVLSEALPWAAPPGAAAAAPSGDLLGEGFLVDAGGEPVARGFVCVLESGARQQADDVGRYRIALPDRPATLVAWDGRGRVARGEPFAAPRTSAVVPLPELALTGGATLRGYLRDAEGNAAADAAVELRGPAGLRRTATDPNGAFRFGGLLAGRYDIAVLPYRGFLGIERPLDVSASGADLDLALEAARPRTVQVLEESKPVAEAWVVASESELRRAVARTDPQGQARLSGLGDGPVVFEVRDAALAAYEVVAFDDEQARLTVRRPPP